MKSKKADCMKVLNMECGIWNFFLLDGANEGVADLNNGLLKCDSSALLDIEGFKRRGNWASGWPILDWIAKFFSYPYIFWKRCPSMKASCVDSYGIKYSTTYIYDLCKAILIAKNYLQSLVEWCWS